MRALIVEDHADIAGNVGDFLALRGHTVDFALDGQAGLQLASVETFDVIILDINLPRIDGFEVCRRLRLEHQNMTPVLMLTARAALVDKVKGFEVGAWDYLVKPFALEELAVRLDALMLRQDPAKSREIEYGAVRVDLAARRAWREDQALDLHESSLKILAALVRAAPNVVSTKELEYLLWGDHPPVSQPLRSHLTALRNALDRPFPKALLETVRGVGYRLRSDGGEGL